MPRNRKSYVIYKIVEGKLQHEATVSGIPNACKVTKQYNANIHLFLKGKTSSLGEYIVVEGKENSFDTLVQANTRLNRQKLLPFNFKVNQLTDQQVEAIVKIIETKETN